jgi:putative mycofactocin binding protein MftB
LRGILAVTYRLTDRVQVRKEGWGLLFYQQTRHKMFFVRSGDWLYPQHFDGTWTEQGIIEDIVERTGTPAEIIERSLPKLTKRLTSSRLITDEVR